MPFKKRAITKRAANRSRAPNGAFKAKIIASNLAELVEQDHSHAPSAVATKHAGIEGLQTPNEVRHRYDHNSRDTHASPPKDSSEIVSGNPDKGQENTIIEKSPAEEPTPSASPESQPRSGQPSSRTTPSAMDHTKSPPATTSRAGSRPSPRNSASSSPSPNRNIGEEPIGFMPSSTNNFQFVHHSPTGRTAKELDELFRLPRKSVVERFPMSHQYLEQRPMPNCAKKYVADMERRAAKWRE